VLPLLPGRTERYDFAQYRHALFTMLDIGLSKRAGE
jgi:hypothetical protein